MEARAANERGGRVFKRVARRLRYDFAGSLRQHRQRPAPEPPVQRAWRHRIDTSLWLALVAAAANLLWI